MAVCRRNLLGHARLGRAASHRGVARRCRTSCHQYVVLLAPGAARTSAQRDRVGILLGALSLWVLAIGHEDAIYDQLCQYRNMNYLKYR